MVKQFCCIPERLHFTFSEFFNSDYAKQLDILNVTSDPKILTAIATTICCLLEPIRTLCNNFTINAGIEILNPNKKYVLVQLKQPEDLGITLTGGWRSKVLIEKCKSVLGIIMAATGHPYGECADIKRTPWSNLKLFCVLKTLHEAEYLHFDQLIYEYDTDCCHVGYRAGANRNEILLRKVVNNKLTYTKLN